MEIWVKRRREVPVNLRRLLMLGIISVAAALAVGIADKVHAQTAITGPILPSERDLSEPSRNVPARQFASAYCSGWTDGCTDCSRASADGKASCTDKLDPQQACKPSAIRCTEMFDWANRVCLTFTDGCNQCLFSGRCSAMLCVRQSPGGKIEPWFPLNFTCTDFRRTDYTGHEDDIDIEFTGTWKLTNPQGRTCKLVLVNPGTLRWHHSCANLLPGVTAWETGKSTLQLESDSASPQNPLISFDTSTGFEHLKSAAPTLGYALDRLSTDLNDHDEAEDDNPQDNNPH